MIVDSHVHLRGGDIYDVDVGPDRTIYRMNQAGIDRSIVFSVGLPSRESNDLVLQAVHGREDCLIPFAHAVALEGRPALDEVKRGVSQGCRGLKLHFGELRGLEPTDDLFLPMLELSASLDIPVLLDCNDRPEYPDRWADAVPEAKLIIAHLGSSSSREMNRRFFEVVRRHLNVWLDTSYTSGPYMILEAYRTLGPRKLIWGSDAFGDFYPPLVELAKIQVWELPDDDLGQMMAGNVIGLLGGT